jgi:hypothetical protein
MAWPRIGIIPTWGHLHPLREGVANEPHHWMNREDQKNERLRDPPQPQGHGGRAAPFSELRQSGIRSFSCCL